MTATVSQLSSHLTLKAALWYAEYGFHVFPIHSIQGGLCTCNVGGRCNSPGKHPRTAHGCKDATTDVKKITEWFTKWPNSGIGIATGPSNLVVVDVDPRNRGDVSMAELPPLPLTPVTLTGGGGLHYYFRKPSGQYKCGTLAQGVDIKADGGYVAAPPSLHISGTPYRADPEARIGEVPLADLPDWITEQLKTVKPHRRSSNRVTDGYLGAAFEAAGWLGKQLGTDRTAAKCPWNAEHTTGKPFDSSTVIFAPQDGSNLGWGYCSHGHCINRTLQDWLDAIPEDAHVIARERLKLDPDYTPSTTENKPLPDATWVHSLTFDDRGRVAKDPGNAALILAHEAGWAGCIAFDEFRNTPVWIRQPPPLDGIPLPSLGPCAEADWVFVQQSLRHLRGVSFSKDAIFDAVYTASQEQKFHPVRDYLNLLEWDRIPRVDRWMATYLGTEDNPYTRLVSRWSLIAPIARVFEPGCKVDTMVILEGPQGLGKSTALRILSVRWFCDSAFDLGNKDAYMVLKGKWFSEIAELDAIIRADPARSKAFLTSPIDTYRPPYRRDVVDVPRQSVFWGTVNHHEYLGDETGGRRQLPIECRLIDLTGLSRDVDMLWAEALHMYRAGMKWWPSTEAESALCNEVQMSRYVGDEWEGIIADYLSAHKLTRFSSADILRNCLQFSPKDWNRGHENRVGKCLKRLGYKQYRTKSSRYWVTSVTSSIK
jgi:hypothetical protein